MGCVKIVSVQFIAHECSRATRSNTVTLNYLPPLLDPASALLPGYLSGDLLKATWFKSVGHITQTLKKRQSATALVWHSKAAACTITNSKITDYYIAISRTQVKVDNDRKACLSHKYLRGQFHFIIYSK